MKRHDQPNLRCSLIRLPESALTLRLAFALLLVVPSIAYAGPQAPQGARPPTSFNPPSLSGNGSGNQGGAGQGGTSSGGSANNGGASSGGTANTGGTTSGAPALPPAAPTTSSGNQNQIPPSVPSPEQIELKDTALGVSVRNLFQRVFGREPSLTELEYRVWQLQNSRNTHVTMQQIEADYLNSREYYQKSVNQLYKKYLDRHISPEGFDKLFKAKPRPSLDAVEQSLIYSEEYVERWLNAQFRELLRRCPYDSEYNKLVERLVQKKVSFDTVRNGIRKSKEAAEVNTSRKPPYACFRKDLCLGSGDFNEDSSEWESPVWCKRNLDGTRSYFFRRFSEESDVGHPYYVDFPINRSQYAELQKKWESSSDLTLWAITNPDGTQSYFWREYSQDSDLGPPYYLDLPISRAQYDAMRKLNACASNDNDDFEFVDEIASGVSLHEIPRIENLILEEVAQCLAQNLNASDDDKEALLCHLYGEDFSNPDLTEQLMMTCAEQHLKASGYVEDEMLCALYYPEYFVRGYVQTTPSGFGGPKYTFPQPSTRTRRGRKGTEPAGPFDQLGDCLVRAVDTVAVSFDGFLNACGLTENEKHALGLPTMVKKRSRGLFKGLRCKARK
jgi:hypothetical protein